MSENTPATTKAPADQYAVAIKNNMKAIESICSSHVDVKRLIRISLNARANSDQLANCTTQSLVLSVINCAEIGLEPGVMQECAFVPYKGQCTMQPMYQGLIKLARRSGALSKISATIVRKGDDFNYHLGLNPDIHHIPDGSSEREWTHVYAVAHLSDGETQFEVMDNAEVMKVKAKAKAKSGPWMDYEEQMAKKTVLKRLLKLLPKGEDHALAAALHYDDRAEVGKPQTSSVDPALLEGITIQADAPEQEPIKQPKRVEEVPPESAEAPQSTAEGSNGAEGGGNAPPEEDVPLQPHEMDQDAVMDELNEIEKNSPQGPLKRAREALGITVNEALFDTEPEKRAELLRAYRVAIG